LQIKKGRDGLKTRLSPGRGWMMKKKARPEEGETLSRGVVLRRIDHRKILLASKMNSRL